MISLTEMSSNLTNFITKDLEYNEDKKEIIDYAIETTLLSIFGTLLLILFAFTVNALKAALFAAIFGVLLRRVSGGAHFNTPSKCLVFGALLYSAIGFIAKKLIEYHLIRDYMLWLFLLLSLLIVFFLAPVDSENKPIHSEKLKFRLKGLSIAFVLVAFFISLISSNLLLNASMCMGILYQSITLLPIFNKRGGG